MHRSNTTGNNYGSRPPYPQQAQQPYPANPQVPGPPPLDRNGVPLVPAMQPHLINNYWQPPPPPPPQYAPLPRYHHDPREQLLPQQSLPSRPGYSPNSSPPPPPRQQHPAARSYQLGPQAQPPRAPYMGPGPPAGHPPPGPQHPQGLSRSNTYRPPPQYPAHHAAPPRQDSHAPLPHVYAPPPSPSFRPYIPPQQQHQQQQHPQHHQHQQHVLYQQQPHPIGPNRTVAPHPFQSYYAPHPQQQQQQQHAEIGTPFAIPQYRLPPHLQHQQLQREQAQAPQQMAQNGMQWAPPSRESRAPDGLYSENASRRPPHPMPPPRIDSDPSEASTVVNLGRRQSVASTADSIGLPPPIYPAMLSMVAEAFRAKVPLGNRVKDSLDYTDCFVGRDAVDTIAYLIKSTDRNLSLLLGRALDAQKFFHDVTYNHRLRDSPNELYKFQSPTAPGPTGSSVTPILEELMMANGASADPEDGGLPNGVFTLLTDCYSPTCTRDRLCYSVACPRRLEQQTRLLTHTSSQLQRSPSRVSLTEVGKDHQLWSTSVPKEIVESVSDHERKRQEVIFETIQTEREFVADLEIIERVFVEPLRKSDIISADRMETFIEDVFYNVHELYTINSRLLAKLLARQKEGNIVDKIGDIFVSVVDEFEAYVRYGGQQVLAKYALDQERASNPEFARFLQECERLPECRKLPIQSFLARPTTRVGRYPLLLRSAMNASADHHPDRTLIPQAVHVIKEVLSSINREAGRAENQLKLDQLQMSLVFNPGEVLDLKLDRPETLIVREGHLVLRKSGGEIDLHVFLFDHILLLTKVKKAGLHKVYKKPIPLEFLVVGEQHNGNRRSSGLFGSSGHKSSPSGSFSHTHSFPNSGTSGKASREASVRSGQQSGSSLPSAIAAPITGFPFTITHLGREGATYTLYAASQADRRTWRDIINQQKSILTDSKKRFELQAVCESLFPSSNRVNTSTVYKDKLVLGTDLGLLVGPLNAFEESTPPAVKSVIDSTPTQSIVPSPAASVCSLSPASTVTGATMGASAGGAKAKQQSHIPPHVKTGSRRTSMETPSMASALNVSPSTSSPSSYFSTAFRRVVDIEKVVQVDVLPEHNLVTLLAERALWTYPIDILLDPLSPADAGTASLPGTPGSANGSGAGEMSASSIAARKGEKISAHLNFYKNGVCRDRTFISGVRLTALNSTVKIYEPVGINNETKKKGKFGKFFSAPECSVKTFKEFYIPAEASSIHYLRTKLCVGCSKGFEVVDLETLMPQGLIDVEDDRMDFVNKREGLKPISIFRLANGDFLLCYNEFGFYIDRFGSRTKGDALIHWAGYPTSFTFSAPYIIAYEPSFIEIRNVDTTALQQIIPTHNLRTLNCDTRHVVVEHPGAIGGDNQNVCRLVELSNGSAIYDELPVTTVMTGSTMDGGLDLPPYKA
ncbi:RHO1 GDP-GTP exchange protein 2 [Geranomyces variabilis]|uniref:RHO1 GDP-GTP exchange protein 2 n=1 Tax=Geranomyces variabilis TaxID=109894 RepID=A0AAD5XRV7_9FUNG|nr:RHO1 GDP-GTP exchange protein 2 [Geranomyces variabilis]